MEIESQKIKAGGVTWDVKKYGWYYYAMADDIVMASGVTPKAAVKKAVHRLQQMKQKVKQNGSRKDK